MSIENFPGGERRFSLSQSDEMIEELEEDKRKIMSKGLHGLSGDKDVRRENEEKIAALSEMEKRAFDQGEPEQLRNYFYGKSLKLEKQYASEDKFQVNRARECMKELAEILQQLGSENKGTAERAKQLLEEILGLLEGAIGAKRFEVGEKILDKRFEFDSLLKETIQKMSGAKKFEIAPEVYGRQADINYSIDTLLKGHQDLEQLKEFVAILDEEVARKTGSAA